MNMCASFRAGGCDASGAPFDPTGVVYMAVDMQGMFVDAVDSGNPANSEIVEYCSCDPRMGVCAFIRNKHTGVVALYGMNVKSGVPFLIKTPEGEPPRRRKRRPKTSREWKLFVARKRWEER